MEVYCSLCKNSKNRHSCIPAGSVGSSSSGNHLQLNMNAGKSDDCPVKPPSSKDGRTVGTSSEEDCYYTAVDTEGQSQPTDSLTNASGDVSSENLGNITTLHQKFVEHTPSRPRGSAGFKARRSFSAKARKSISTQTSSTAPNVEDAAISSFNYVPSEYQVWHPSAHLTLVDRGMQTELVPNNIGQIVSSRYRTERMLLPEPYRKSMRTIPSDSGDSDGGVSVTKIGRFMVRDLRNMSSGTRTGVVTNFNNSASSPNSDRVGCLKSECKTSDGAAVMPVGVTSPKCHTPAESTSTNKSACLSHFNLTERKPVGQGMAFPRWKSVESLRKLSTEAMLMEEDTKNIEILREREDNFQCLLIHVNVVMAEQAPDMSKIRATRMTSLREKLIKVLSLLQGSLKLGRLASDVAIDIDILSKEIRALNELCERDDSLLSSPGTNKSTPTSTLSAPGISTSAAIGKSFPPESRMSAPAIRSSTPKSMLSSPLAQPSNLKSDTSAPPIALLIASSKPKQTSQKPMGLSEFLKGLSASTPGFSAPVMQEPVTTAEASSTPCLITAADEVSSPLVRSEPIRPTGHMVKHWSKVIDDHRRVALNSRCLTGRKKTHKSLRGSDQVWSSTGASKSASSIPPITDRGKGSEQDIKPASMSAPVLPLKIVYKSKSTVMLSDINKVFKAITKSGLPESYLFRQLSDRFMITSSAKSDSCKKSDAAMNTELQLISQYPASSSSAAASFSGSISVSINSADTSPHTPLPQHHPAEPETATDHISIQLSPPVDLSHTIKPSAVKTKFRTRLTLLSKMLLPSMHCRKGQPDSPGQLFVDLEKPTSDEAAVAVNNGGGDEAQKTNCEEGTAKDPTNANHSVQSNYRKHMPRSSTPSVQDDHCYDGDFSLFAVSAEAPHSESEFQCVYQPYRPPRIKKILRLNSAAAARKEMRRVSRRSCSSESERRPTPIPRSATGEDVSPRIFREHPGSMDYIEYIGDPVNCSFKSVANDGELRRMNGNGGHVEHFLFRHND